MAEKVDGIPDVDLTPIKAELEKVVDLGQFKSVEDQVAAYKELQGAFTRVSQENKALKDGGNDDAVAQLQAELDSAREQIELASMQRPDPNQSNQPRNFDESWMESPENTIDQRVAAQLATARINDVLEEEDMKNPAEFQERYAYADMLAKDPKYAPLARTPAGVKRLFMEADKRRKQSLKDTIDKSLVFLNDGEPLDDEQLANAKKVLFGKKTKQSNNDAYMPDGSTSTKSAADSESERDSNAKVNAAVKKGDVDGVLDAMFDDIRA